MTEHLPDPSKKPLIVDRYVVSDLIDQIKRMMQLHTENFSIHMDTYAIQITIIPEPTAPFILPNGPLDIRVHHGHSEYV